MVDRGLLDWTSTVPEVLGKGFPMRDEYRTVTLEQLLSHTAGLPANIPRDEWLTFFPYDSSAGADRTRMISKALTLTPEFTPGTSYLYSNLGYVLAGKMVEEVTGEDWESLMRKEIFEPLDMNGAGFGPPGRIPGNGITAPWEHAPAPVDPDFEYADNPAALGPAGTVHTSLEDLEKYVSIYFSGGKSLSGRRVISEESLDEIMKPRLQNYSLGWLVYTDNRGHRFLAHDGSNNMFYSSMLVFPETRDAVIVLGNRGDGQAAAGVTELLRYFSERYSLKSVGHQQ